jgi:hypothetical protein
LVGGCSRSYLEIKEERDGEEEHKRKFKSILLYSIKM